MYFDPNDTSTQANTLEGLGGWGDMLQNAVGKWAGSAIDQRYNQQYQIAKMQLQSRAPDGSYYVDGQPGLAGSPVVSASASGQIPMSWLLIGGLVLFARSGD
jgi:hypothetical protein